MMSIENVNRQKFRNSLEIRPYPKGYQLDDKKDRGFGVDTTYYFGIRIKNFQNPEVNGDIRDVHPQIDLTECRTKFFNQVSGMILVTDKRDFCYDELRKKNEIDIDIQCLSRDMLPSIVRPVEKPKPGKTIPAQDLEAP